jgi:hypothetical protein
MQNKSQNAEKSLFILSFYAEKKAGNPQFSRVSGLKLTAGIEPATYALRVRRSTD